MNTLDQQAGAYTLACLIYIYLKQKDHAGVDILTFFAYNIYNILKILREVNQYD